MTQSQVMRSHKSQRVKNTALPSWMVHIHRQRLWILLGILVLVVSSDQFSKIWVRDNLAKPLPRGAGFITNDDLQHYAAQRELKVVDGVFHIIYVENPAAAFSLALRLDERYRRPVLFATFYFAMALILLWLWRLKSPDLLMILALSLIISGAVGNAIDRHLYGYVIDFVSWRLMRWFPSLPPWPTFNIADSAIVAGAIGIMLRAFVPFPSKALRD